MDFMFSVPLTIFLRVTDMKNAVAQAIKNGKLTEQLQAAEIECVRLNNKIEELESILSEERGADNG